MTDDEDPLLAAREQPFVRVGVAERRRIEALAARERVAAPVAALPRAIDLDRVALELADVDVVEQRLDLYRHVASGERDRGRLLRAPEAGVDAEVELEPGELDGEGGRLGLSLRRQRDADGRIAVDALRHVQLRLAVADEDEQAHGV